ncbi:citryl-CoA lyase [Herbaspirillum lusitanum]|uniref:citryl-CoA lyase n=1 Tax=Herbaspirillum lusitanum TaxID=213312 RepID=UPI0002FA26B8|nr:citryl-CoA lyase [Herbaspirillum lusitanum]
MTTQQVDAIQPSEADRNADLVAKAKAWWSTSIIDIQPGIIRIKGEPIENMIGNVGYVHMVWRMLRDDIPSAGQLHLLEAALVSAVDHGPQAPSIAIARMSVTCGLPLNGAMSSAINMLDDIHGGAGEQCLLLFNQLLDAAEASAGEPESVLEQVMAAHAKAHGRIVPGYGHRFHPIDPRAVKLLAMVDEAAAAGVVKGLHAKAGRLIEAHLAGRSSKPVPMNIDGATAVIYGELGFDAALARGLFILSRSVGILAHAWEQKKQGGRIKGPMPPSMGYTYTGPAANE